MSELFDKLKAAVAPRYQLETELGSGGMATVYLALDVIHQRKVALKVLHPRLAGAVGHDRFLQEIRFAAELTHPHILPLLDSGTVTVDDRTLPYYVMPFVDGESLRARLQRQKQLPIEEAVAIARDVAAALTYAHGHRVVHRDIKPENILLAGSEAVVADFGIARAINRAAESEVITTEGMAVGTPAYMSPEQSLAMEEIDGRSDIYSLGCVLYEMLGGAPPFTGGTPQAIVARHQWDPVPSLTTIRPTVPVALEIIIKKTLQKHAADRFQSAGELAAALGSTASGNVPTVETGQSKAARWGWVGLLALVTGAVLIATKDNRGGTNSVNPSALDTTLYAIVSTGDSEPGMEQLDPDLLLRDALSRWTGVKVIDAFQVQGMLSTMGPDVADRAREAARQLGAGRYIRVDVSRQAGFQMVHAVLYDTDRRAQLVDHVARLATDYANSDSVFALIADRMLFRDNQPRIALEAVVGTVSVPARQAFERGYKALEDWDLPGADSAFEAASRHDPQYSQALLWLALVRLWSGEQVEHWSSPIERAYAGRERLSPRDKRVADAVLAQERGDYPGACGGWSRLATQDQYSFIAWYGWADCLKRDNIVIRDPKSPTGWRFRSSYHQALESYQRAFELLPSIHRSLSEESFASTRRLLHTSENDLRGGRALPPDTMLFFAAPSWQHDSLVFFPIPDHDMAAGRSPSTATTPDAVLHQRQRFQRIAASWAAVMPTSADAALALATSLEIQGDRSALGIINHARSLAATPQEKLRVAGAEIRMLIRFSIPDHLDDLSRARSMSDSILQEHPAPNPVEPHLLATLAALTGHVQRAAQLSLTPSVQEAWGVPPGLASAAPLLVYAAMGQPEDSLRILERRVAKAIAQDIALSERQEIRLEWLGFPATLAFPEHRLTSITTLDGAGDMLLSTQAALLRGDTLAVRRVLRNLRQTRARVRPSDMALDNLFLEAFLLRSLNDPQAAADWLDPTLDAIAGSAPQFFSEPYRVGPIIRAMALRAELAAQLKDPKTARRWAAAVMVLWSGADDILQPVVRRMEVLMD